MTTAATDNWYEANHRYLVAALGVVREALERGGAAAPEAGAARRALDEAAAALPAPAALEVLCTTFGLSPFERELLLLCAGVELDAAFGDLCAAAQGDPMRNYPTFSLALAALADPHWSALMPSAPLRHWRLVELASGGTLTLSPLRIDERVLHHLTGASHLDERLVGLVELVRDAGALVPSHVALAEQIAATWSRAAGRSALPVIQLCGEADSKRAIAGAACAACGLGLGALPADLLPTGPGDLEGLMRLWEREAALSGSALLLECDDLDPADAGRAAALARLIERTAAPLVVAGRERRRIQRRPSIALDVRRPGVDEQRALWQHALGDDAAALNGYVEALVSQFSLGASAIRAAGAQALGEIGDQRLEIGDSSPNLQSPISNLQERLWDACRMEARPHLDELAQRIEPAATWDDLVLPEAQRQTLREIAAHVRQRARVYESWGFAAKGARGLGISALFAGASGTGKTMAAEVLANELRLDLYRIDLSSVVSKYIGETEKNLRRVFDAAEGGGAILLFDEADALFGKRSEVKDSHDRYANIEVSYLLQRMEAYRGLAILTTNMKSALDTAFLRRIRFIVQFPFPDAAQRADIWRRIFPVATPTEALDVGKLARLNVAGGNIRNIALNAAFLAADEGMPVRMAHLLRAARSEYTKLEKSLTDGEVRDWVTR